MRKKKGGRNIYILQIIIKQIIKHITNYLQNYITNIYITNKHTYMERVIFLEQHLKKDQFKLKEYLFVKGYE